MEYKKRNSEKEKKKLEKSKVEIEKEEEFKKLEAMFAKKKEAREN